MRTEGSIIVLRICHRAAVARRVKAARGHKSRTANEGRLSQALFGRITGMQSLPDMEGDESCRFPPPIPALAV